MTDPKRMSIDCRKSGVENCDVCISGTENHVMEAAVQHAVGSHGMSDSPELRSDIKSMLVMEE